MRTSFTLFTLVLLTFLTTTDYLLAVAVTHYTDAGLGPMTTTNAEQWGPRPGGADNITSNDAVFEFVFDYTADLATLGNSNPVVMWESGGTGTGAALILDGANLVFFAGNNSADFVSGAHGLTAGDSRVQVVSSFSPNDLNLFVKGANIGSATPGTGGDWSGTDTSGIGIGANVIYADGGAAPFTAGDVQNYDDGGANLTNFAVYDAEKAGFNINDVLGRSLVFSTGFEYVAEPSASDVGTDAANLNGAIGQIGQFTGTVPDGSGGGQFGSDFIGFANNTRDGGRLGWFDRPDADGQFTAELDGAVKLEGAVVSFDVGTRRTQGGTNEKDYDIVGLDIDGNEVFHLIVDTDNNNPSRRVAVLTDNGATRIEDLEAVFGLASQTGAGEDNNNLLNTGGVPENDELAHISLSLSNDGYTIDFIRDGDSYVTSALIPFNGSPINLSEIDIRFGGGADSVSSGFFLDNLDVRGFLDIPEPTTATLGLLGLCGLACRRRRRQA